MNLRLEAILKKEKNLYKDITDELKGKKFAKLNPDLEKTIAMLLERKQLIEQLNKEALEDAEREALYKSIEDNNKYFAEEVDRADINNQFMQADDSYAKSAEWQNLHMAFLSTASVASYKAVDTFNDNLKDLRNRRENIRQGLTLTKKDIARAQSIDPETNVTNAAEQLEKYKKEQEKAAKEFREKEKEFFKGTEAIHGDFKQYPADKIKYEREKKLFDAFVKLEKDVKKDIKYKMLFMTPEQYEKLIEEQKAILQKKEEERAKAIENASDAYKSYIDAAYTEEEKEKITFFDELKNDFDVLKKGYANDIAEFFGAALTIERDSERNVKNSLRNIFFELNNKFTARSENYRKLEATIKRFDDNIIKLVNMHMDNNPDKTYAEARTFVEELPIADVEKLIDKMKNEITNQLDKRKAEIFNTLSEEEKNLISPSKETKAAENEIKDNIKKLEDAKTKNVKRTEAEFNKEYNLLINRKIKEGGYGVKGISDKDLEKINGDKWLKEAIQKEKQLTDNYENKMKISEVGYKKYVALEEKFKPTKDAYEKNKAEYDKKVEHAKKMTKPQWNFNFHKYKEALDKNCKDVPKLDLKALMEEKRVAGNDLLQMVDAYTGNHKNSPEFDAMVSSMLYVANWGTPMALPTTYRNAPKTFEQAIDQLKANCKKYEDAKKEQHRPFPSKMRHLRLQMVKAFDMYADTQRESLKGFQMTEELADKWNKYFEVKSQEKDELEQKNEWGIPNVQTDIKKEELYKDEFYKDDPVLESDEMGNAR